MFRQHRATSARKTSASRQAMQIEKLERREVFAAAITASMQAGSLMIEGTNGNDQIQVRFYNNTVQVPGVQIRNAQGNLVSSVNRSEITGRVMAYGLQGTDVIRVVEVGNPSLPVTFDGGEGADALVGGSGHDQLKGGAGNDRLYGGSGTDAMWGGDGDDRLFGDLGSDVLRGDAGNDWLVGASDGNNSETGSDRIYGGTGDDTLFGGGGNDRLVGEVGNDVIYGEDGNDWLVGCVDGDGSETGIDRIYGGNGDDTLWGGAGNDRLFGDVGNDLIYGEAGDDFMNGASETNNTESGADRIYGGTGNDTLLGGAGPDRLVGEWGNDTIYGEDGNDWLVGCVDGDGSETGIDQIYGGIGDDTVWGGAGNDRLFGDVGNDLIYGEDGDDFMNGASETDSTETGADRIYGGTGDDTLLGGAGPDRLLGEWGNDTIDGQEGNDWLVGCVDYDGSETGMDKIYGGSGDDTLWGGAGDDLLVGGVGNDHIDGELGFDTISEMFLVTASLSDSALSATRIGILGMESDQIVGIEKAELYSANAFNTATTLNATQFTGVANLFGGISNDTLLGGSNNDYLSGGGGNDKMFGNGGYDYILGGAGDDFMDPGSAGEWLVYGEEGNDINAWIVAVGGANASDVHQGGVPDCWLGAAIASVASKGIDLASRITYLGNAQYSVSLWTGIPDIVTIITNVVVNFDGTILKSMSGGDADYLPHYGSEGDTWVTILSRAYLISRGIDPANPQRGNSMDALYALTGRASTNEGFSIASGTGATAIYNSLTDATRISITNALAAGRNVVASSEDFPSEVAQHIVTDHAYAVVNIYDAGIGGGILVELRNPHGTDSDGIDDGIVTLRWADFARSFQGITIN